MAFVINDLYASIRNMARDLLSDQRIVEDELQALTEEDPVAGVIVRGLVGGEWDTMSGQTAFWEVLFVLKTPEIMGIDSTAKYPKIAKFFQYYMTRAILLVSLRLPDAIPILSSLLNGIQLTPQERTDLLEGYQALLDRRRALLHGRRDNAQPSASTSNTATTTTGR